MTPGGKFLLIVAGAPTICGHKRVGEYRTSDTINSTPPGSRICVTVLVETPELVDKVMRDQGASWALPAADYITPGSVSVVHVWVGSGRRGFQVPTASRSIKRSNLLNSDRLVST